MELSEKIKNKDKTRPHLLHLLETDSEGGETGFRERKCDFYLDFPAFGPSVLVGQEAKLIYAVMATRGHRFCGVSITRRGRVLLLLGLFFG